MGNDINIAQSDQLIGQQAQRPVVPSGWGRGAGQRHQVGFNLPVQLAFSPTGGATSMQGCVQPFFHEALADTVNRLASDIEGLFDSLVAPSRTLGTAISLEQDLGMGTHLPRGSAGMYQFGKVGAFIGSQSYDILSVSRHWIEHLQSTDLETVGCWILPDPCLPII